MKRLKVCVNVYLSIFFSSTNPVNLLDSNFVRPSIQVPLGLERTETPRLYDPNVLEPLINPLRNDFFSSPNPGPLLPAPQTSEGNETFTSQQLCEREVTLHPESVVKCEKNSSPLKRKRDRERNWPCTYRDCGQSFPSECHLRRHTRMHTGERPFICTWVEKDTGKICDKKFAEKSTLKRHLQTHTGAKPFPCQAMNCPKVFADKVNLKRHLRLIHGIRSNETLHSQAQKRVKINDDVGSQSSLWLFQVNV